MGEQAWLFLVSLFIGVCAYLVASHMIDRWLVLSIRKRRFSQEKRKGMTPPASDEPAWFSHLAALREAAGLSLSYRLWRGFTLLLLVVGGFAAGWAPKNLSAGVLIGIGLAFSPTYYMLYRAEQYRAKTANEMLPALEIFLNELTREKNVVRAIENTSYAAPDAVKKEFERMASECYAGYDAGEVLRRFSARMHNKWVRLYVSLLLLHEEKGAKVEGSLFNVIAQMRSVELENFKKRAELASVRSLHALLMLGVMVLFALALFIEPGNYAYYTESALGRGVVTGAIFALLVSMGIFYQMNREELM